jgi:hypothetical protein
MVACKIMIKSQIALHSQLANPFYHLDLREDVANSTSLKNQFEDNKIILIDGLPMDYISPFLSWPSTTFPDWVAPLMSTTIREASISAEHPLFPYCNSLLRVEEFVVHLNNFERWFAKELRTLFPSYTPSKEIFSWRFNKMDLGYLHLDIPPDTVDHQFRAFVNLSHRPRIIEVGPSLEELMAKFSEHDDLEKWSDLPASNFLQAIKERFFKQQGLEDFYLPRHTLRLAPGALWICHSSLITHGLVFGEKTVCCEWRIPVNQLEDPESSFQYRLQRARSGKSATLWGYDGDPALGS